MKLPPVNKNVFLVHKPRKLDSQFPNESLEWLLFWKIIIVNNEFKNTINLSDKRILDSPINISNKGHWYKERKGSKLDRTDIEKEKVVNLPSVALAQAKELSKYDSMYSLSFV